jgi:hypothetical protein
MEGGQVLLTIYRLRVFVGKDISEIWKEIPSDYFNLIYM